MYRTQIERMLQKTNKEIQELEKEVQRYPRGSLSCLANGKYVKWFQVEKGKRIYIPKKQKQKAISLAKKQILSASLQDLYQDQKSLQSYLQKNENYISKKEKLLENPHYQGLLNGQSGNFSKELSEWVQEDYPRNPYAPENLKFRSISGNIVRSKSELMIDQSLFLKEIPYRYECELCFGDVILYPDFTIRHPRNGKILYWEHFGMMDNSSYAQKAFAKLRQYSENGYIPTINLITTFETKDHPLDYEIIQRVMEQHLE